MTNFTPGDTVEIMLRDGHWRPAIITHVSPNHNFKGVTVRLRSNGEYGNYKYVEKSKVRKIA